ncbi:hypothetical protein [Oceanobacillus massiliensis]|uniref:hypothetical protein n=1 Tax=Oceanobacillus massiliensis TaxID=1465765 RepID=UPI001F290AA7|nr:hypothetical protein [Oceanobacillus massiliensis]
MTSKSNYLHTLLMACPIFCCWMVGLWDKVFSMSMIFFGICSPRATTLAIASLSPITSILVAGSLIAMK